MGRAKKPQAAASSARSARSVVNLGSGWRRPSEEFDVYGEAFRRAGQKLIQSFEDDPARDDFDACPIVFLFRHAVELYLKAILRAGQFLLGLYGSSFTFNESILTRHKLEPLLAQTRKLFEEFNCLQTCEQFSSFVKELDGIDPTSFAFRYPVNKQDAASLPESLIFDLSDFAAHADEVLDVLSNEMCAFEAGIQSATENLSGFTEEW